MRYYTLRVARHTDNLEQLINFYQRIVGLSLLGRFEDHESYSGAFLGLTGAQWHLEFTTSPHPPVHTTDPDDALVLYVNSQEELNDQRATLERENIALVTNRNPYWNRHGITFRDPDGFLVIFAYPRLYPQV
ncbi:MAG: VOC family protein [Flavobacteriales bacterium]|nr:VOC family protein [Flavobacteriales bacterium]